MARLLVINGPNLNMLGIREPHIYGSTTLAAIEASCREFADYLGVGLAFHQSNSESAIVDLIQSARGSVDALIINPAAYSFTSVAITTPSRSSRAPSWRCTSPTSTPVMSSTVIPGSPRPRPR
jgi:3-dehydroquinate dehydratase-2